MNLLSPTIQAKIEQGLVTEGYVTQVELQQIKAKAAQASEPFLNYLINSKKINSEQYTKLLAQVNDMPYVNLTNYHVDSNVLKLLQSDVAEQFMAVPIGEMQGKLVVAMLDADNIQAVDFLGNKIGRPIKAYAASEQGIRRVISQYGSEGLEHGVASILDTGITGTTTEQEVSDKSPREQREAEADQAETIVEDSPISRALSAVMTYAVQNSASDIHIESLEKQLKVRCRVDGVMREIMRLPKNAEAPLVSRIKILSNLKIDEHRIPQDGQFTFKIAGHGVDIRVAISPVVWGEQVVLRLLNKDEVSLKLEDMGYNGRALRMLKKALAMPHGMILTSGPTGSGKTTSMYAMIQAIKNDAINIVTLEDPVEYKIEGVNQIQVNPDVGLTFASGLRSILRQDPDVVMVGEIRDKETANLAVQAALTGHLVFSTLHTNSAAGILPRLLDMEVEPFLIASTVRTVIGQRLLRKAIPGDAYNSSTVETAAIKQVLSNVLPKNVAEAARVGSDLGYQGLPLITQNAYTLIKPRTTPDNRTGFKGRMGLYEVFEISNAIQDLIVKRPTSAVIQRQAQAEGMLTMMQDGYLKALAGLTTLTEVNRVASADS